jgi:hypothetical protein
LFSIQLHEVFHGVNSPNEIVHFISTRKTSEFTVDKRAQIAVQSNEHSVSSSSSEIIKKSSGKKASLYLSLKSLCFKVRFLCSPSLSRSHRIILTIRNFHSRSQTFKAPTFMAFSNKVNLKSECDTSLAIYIIAESIS